MSPEIWPVMTMGIVILIAIATSNRSLCRELGERIDALNERLADVRERLGRVEGLLEGFQWTRRKRASKERGDEKHGRALP